LGRQSKYPEEFRRQAAMLVVDGQRPAREVARELGVNHETLRNWVDGLKRERAAPGGPISPDERAELARLRRKVAELELEKEILKKAAVNSSGQRNSAASLSPGCRNRGSCGGGS
jgi:transposase